MATNMEKIIERFNGIMEACEAEHCTIGTRFSEDTENWNLRDMVAECDYWLDTFYEDGHSNHDLISDDPNTWKSITGKLKRFIARFKAEALTMTAWTGHCSKYDGKHFLSDEQESAETEDTATRIIEDLKAERTAHIASDTYLAYGDNIQKEIADELEEELDDEELYWWGDDIVPVWKLNIWQTNLDSAEFRAQLEEAIEEYGWR